MRAGFASGLRQVYDGFASASLLVNTAVILMVHPCFDLRRFASGLRRPLIPACRN